MHCDSNHPGLKKYREVRARAKEQAIMRNKIRETNPNLSDSQIVEIMRASARSKEAAAISIENSRKNKNRVTVQKVNRAVH